MLSYDLITVFGDLELMVLNLIESGIQSMFMMRVLFLRFRRHLKLMIIHLKQDILNCNYKDPNERSIYVKFSSRARYYDKIFMSLGVVTTVSWYLMPLQNYILACEYNIFYPSKFIYTFVAIHDRPHCYLFCTQGFLMVL